MIVASVNPTLHELKWRCPQCLLLSRPSKRPVTFLVFVLYTFHKHNIHYLYKETFLKLFTFFLVSKLSKTKRKYTSHIIKRRIKLMLNNNNKMTLFLSIHIQTVENNL